MGTSWKSWILFCSSLGEKGCPELLQTQTLSELATKTVFWVHKLGQPNHISSNMSVNPPHCFSQEIVPLCRSINSKERCSTRRFPYQWPCFFHFHGTNTFCRVRPGQKSSSAWIFTQIEYKRDHSDFSRTKVWEAAKDSANVFGGQTAQICCTNSSVLSRLPLLVILQ